jgi:1-acyl-sn-glycerol-3-phosphate acyltransferase
MLGFLPAPLIAFIFVPLLVANTLLFSVLILLVMPLRFLMPTHGLRTAIAALLIAFADTWCRINNQVLFRLLPRIEWDIALPEGLSKRHWYFVISNHQSWVDIFVLFYVFTDRIPFLKYFLKQELLYAPFWGQAMYALDYPFMKRYSKETLQRHPELKGKDIETTRRSCEKFRHTPVSVMNFLEGTRFTPVKHDRQQSPYRYLLKPKAGGMALALSALGDQMSCLLDVTIHYPDGNPTFMDLCSGRLRRIVVHVHKREIPHEAFTRDYENDAEFRESLQTWTAALWTRKDAELARLHGKEGE